MRNIFVKKFIEEAEKNKEIYFLTGDLGYNSFEIIKEKFPDRFINVGCAENNMIGIASGLALSGKKVFVYSIVPFLVFRSFEQIRNYICHNNLDIKLLGGGGGFSYGNQGISHNTYEDLSIMRTLPNMKVYSPGTKNELIKTSDFLFQDNAPAYIRLGKIPNFDYQEDQININKGSKVIEGKKIVIFCIGNIIEEVHKAVIKLSKKGLSIKLISLVSLKPLVNKDIIDHIDECEYVFTVEENSIIGGLGSCLAEVISESDLQHIIFHRIGLSDEVHSEIGSQDYLRKIKGIGHDQISDIIDERVSKK